MTNTAKHGDVRSCFWHSEIFTHRLHHVCTHPANFIISLFSLHNVNILYDRAVWLLLIPLVNGVMILSEIRFFDKMPEVALSVLLQFDWRKPISAKYGRALVCRPS